MEHDILGYDSSGQPMYGRSSGKTKTIQEIVDSEEYKEKIAIIVASGFSLEEVRASIAMIAALFPSTKSLEEAYNEGKKAGEAFRELCDQMRKIKPEFPPSNINPASRQYNSKKIKK